MGYIPNTDQDKEKLLSLIGKSFVEELFSDIPAKINKPIPTPGPIPPPLSESELLEELKMLSEENTATTPFLGGGSYNHFIPSVVKHIINRSEFYTAYTPYQAEMSQGILQVIFEYQSMICELTGMDVANASMYDGATALAEAALLACRQTRRTEIVVSSTVHPEYRQVLKTYAKGADLEVRELPYDKNLGTTIHESQVTNHSACLILQQPNFFGCIEDIKGLAEKVRAAGALFIVNVDPISLGILKAPGDYGADIVIGEGQSLGNPQSFGGPGLGIFAVKKNLVRQIPGRVVGQTVDSDGKRGFCLTLQTREQHIRREKATSNICSNEAHAALAATVYLSIMGKQGLQKVAELCLQKAHYLFSKIPSTHYAFPNSIFFKEFVIKTEKKIGLDLERFYPELKGCRLVCVTELDKKEALDQLVANLLA